MGQPDPAVGLVMRQRPAVANSQPRSAVRRLEGGVHKGSCGTQDTLCDLDSTHGLTLSLTTRTGVRAATP